MFSTILHHRKNINFSSFSYHSSLLPPLLACRASSFLDREIMDTVLLQRVLKLVNLVVVELKKPTEFDKICHETKNTQISKYDHF